MMVKMVTILIGDCLDVLKTLPDCSVHCCVTSPPYWGLRDYGVEGQFGLERTPEEYVARLVEVFREVRRVLRDDGTLWLNLGDSYASSGTLDKNGAARMHEWKGDGVNRHRTDGSKDVGKGRAPTVPGLKPKDLVGIPWRVAFALQEDGWYLRSDIIWHKPNPMPESVQDRPTKAHEYMFLLSKSRKYYYDAEAVREESHYRAPKGSGTGRGRYSDDGMGSVPSGGVSANPLGRNRRDVWTIPTRPYRGAHFATFPTALVEPCLLAGTSERGCCPVCGAPWVREMSRTKSPRTERTDNPNLHGLRRCPPEIDTVRTIGWHPVCDCDTDPVPCTVLDPFGGSGTTGYIASRNGRRAVMIELNPKYAKLAHDRCG